ncbi:MAG: segregation and condensation protein B [Chitinophagales bacterium]|nr:MAG: segregation and condensation protein B [Chitinophagales bacterium]
MLEQHIEALIFASEKPVTPKEIKEALKGAYGWEVDEEELSNALTALEERYRAEKYSFHLLQCGGGYQFMTKKDFAPLINTFLNQRSKKRLTRAALETLSIIAYKQPITKAEIEQIRGVNCDYTIQKLLEKELIVIAGRADTLGHPLTYGTSQLFMDYFGINSPADLPKLREIDASHENEIGNAPAIEEEELLLQENPRESNDTGEQEQSEVEEDIPTNTRAERLAERAAALNQAALKSNSADVVS